MAHDSNFLDISTNNGARSLSNLSNLERNCNQIFIKGPAITKDFFDKIQHDVVPQKTDLFGYQMNTRRLILLTGLILLFTFSTMGTITMWFTHSYQKYIFSKMAISEENPGYNLWKAPPASTYINIYVFNYTNVDEFEQGKAKKLHVEEVGPYVYFEKLEKVNVKFNKVDGTVSYQEKRTYEFSKELSKGSKDDLVTVPNVPVLSAASHAKHTFNFLVRMSFSGVLKTFSQKPFKTVTVDMYINGYEDNFYELAKNYMKMQDKRIFDDIGILVWKKGTQPDVYTVHTGALNINKFGQIETFNGKRQVNLWGSDSCNNVQASDGLFYPPHMVRSKQNLTFFVPQMCRKITLQFEKKMTMLDKVPVHRYKIPLFESEQEECYCSKKNYNLMCPPRGVLNSTLCTFGAPIFYSLPYFHNGDPIFKNAISGLEKEPKLEDSYVDIHSKFGLALGGRAHVQVNIQVQKSFGISQLKDYPDDLMLPMVWLETGLNEKDLPADIITVIYLITFTVRNLELGLKYGCLLATMVTLACILLVLKKHRECRRRADSLRRPVTLEH